MRRMAIFTILVACLGLGSASAATFVVLPDGTGDFTTIADAVAAAASGDVISVGAGVYADALTISKSLTIESKSGAAVTVLDGLNAQRIVLVQGACNVTLRGLTMKNAHSDNGAALLVWQQARVVLENCIITDNFATGSNAVHVRHPGSSLRIQNCQFLHNVAGVHSGALSASMGANLHVLDSKFVENQAPGHGAMNAQDSHVEIEGCLFLRNVGGLVGALTLEYSNGFVIGNTFHANSGSAGSVRLHDYTYFSRNIVSGNPRGFGLDTFNGAYHTCNLYDGNQSGAVNRPLGSGEIVDDPLYCDPAADVFLVCSGSPALAGLADCGAMGAFGMGCTCGPVGLESTTWGDLKSLFR